MKKPTSKDITDAYKRLKSKPRGDMRDKMIQNVCIDLLCSVQDGKNN